MLMTLPTLYPLSVLQTIEHRLQGITEQQVFHFGSRIQPLAEDEAVSMGKIHSLELKKIYVLHLTLEGEALAKAATLPLAIDDEESREILVDAQTLKNTAELLKELFWIEVRSMMRLQNGEAFISQDWMVAKRKDSSSRRGLLNSLLGLSQLSLDNK